MRSYHAIILEFDKDFTIKVFQMPNKKKAACIIFVATDTYSIEINNSNIRLVIQWDLPINFDSMIQCISRAGNKRGQATFILFIAKWTQMKNTIELEQCLAKYTNIVNANSLLFDSNKSQVSSKKVVLIT